LFNHPDKDKCIVYRSCLTGSVRPCCTGPDNAADCLNSWSGGAGPSDCKDFTREQYESGVTKDVQISWSASWSLKPGWRYDDWGWLTIPKEEGNYVTHCSCNPNNCRREAVGSSVNGACTSKVPPSRHVEIVIVFKQTS
jgi:hypothetical protein